MKIINNEKVEEAEFAIRRWNELASRELTWAKLADRIEETGDVGSLDTAKKIRDIPGKIAYYVLGVR